MSQDRTGAGLGIERQVSECNGLRERLGWPAAVIYPDNDVSATSRKPRPEWQRLLADVKAGRVDGILVWHLDRLTRKPAELEAVIDLADRHGLKLATVTGEVDLQTPAGRMVARILGSVARGEMEHKSEREILQREQAARAGRRSGGGVRPYGYRLIWSEPEDPDAPRGSRHIIREELEETEAEIVRECARRALAAESLASICRDLRERNIVTSAGRPWTPHKLRRMLASARISGRREYSPRPSGETKRPLIGEIVSDTAKWPAIIEPEESDRLRAMLTSPSRRNYDPATGRTYLLSGILRCGRCGAGMVGRPKSGTPRYVCPNTPGRDYCGTLATVAGRTDEHVRDMVLIALDSPALIDRLRQRDDLTGLAGQIRRDEAELEEIAADKAEGVITRKEWLVQREIVTKRLDAARERLARQSRSSALDGFLGSYDEMLARWEQLNVSQRRAIVSSVLVSLKVNPADPRRKWDPNRFADPEWRV